MKMPANYTKLLLTLEPLSAYSFSAENAFSDGSGTFIEENGLSRPALKKRASYLAASNIMPPQSTVFGTVRRLLLEISGLFKSSWDYTQEEEINQIELIGANSFTFLSNNTDFGVIKSIDPVLVYDKELRYPLLPLPFDRAGSKIVSITDDLVLKDFNYKEWFPRSYLDVSGEIIEKKNIFKDFLNVGNHRLEMTNEEDSVFHIRERYRLQRKYAFATNVYLDLDKTGIVDIGKLTKEPVFVPMGADGTVFKAALSTSVYNLSKFKFPDCTPRIVAISPCLFPGKGWTGKCKAAMVSGTVQRIAQTSGSSLKLNSTRYRLAEPGSVWFFDSKDQRDDFCRIIIDNKPLQIAGFNYVIKYGE
ncbi:MAG: type III-B CRISPR module-associated protein Cmr3 [Eubacteriaceae bacterium]|nr:type III-B CRISPR module-associated protein Cmr3 [Eubacteriaceae bacterium]